MDAPPPHSCGAWNHDEGVWQEHVDELLCTTATDQTSNE
jgi:hypothetical protein